jgi:nickel transport protein
MLRRLSLVQTNTRSIMAAILGACILLTAKPALAHRVLVFAYVEGDTIYTESKFSPDTPVRLGKVLVTDKKTDKVLLTGNTDDQGKFSFKIPEEAKAQKLDLLIVTEAAMGHRGEWLLKADNYLPEATKTAAPAAPSSSAPTASPASPPVAAGGSKSGSIDQQALDAIMERHLGPIREKLTELSLHRTSVTDVIGGLGYIAGIFGLWAYFMSRRQPKS